MIVTSPADPWLALVSRLAFFALAQGAIFLVLSGAGTDRSWQSSVQLWMLSATLANIASFLLLRWRLAREGIGYARLWRWSRETFWKDLMLAVGGFVLAGPIAMLPMRWLGDAVVGSYDVAIAMLFSPLPPWALWLGLLFPFTIGFVELPTYFAYAMPRLERQLGAAGPRGPSLPSR